MCNLCENADPGFASTYLLEQIKKHYREQISVRTTVPKKKEEKPMIEFVQSKEGDPKKVELELVYDRDGANLKVKGGPFICALTHDGILRLFSGLPDYLGFKLTENNRIVVKD